MAEERLFLKTIEDIIKYDFLIPDYQRGYRWKDRQVEDLLDDISLFKQQKEDQNSSVKRSWYCLQPVVVKKREKVNEYEVIDGQQRLTTIYLILRYLSDDEDKDHVFSIKYKTRQNNPGFLENIKEYEDKPNTENIDFYYMSKAYNTIKKRFLKEKEKQGGLTRDFIIKNVRVIWYEAGDEENSFEIFTRLNIGKISLTDSELIKALFLKNPNENFSENNSGRNKTYSTKFEIAKEWDEIEHRLQDDKFWYFLTSDKNRKENRIQWIFEIMAGEDKKNDGKNYGIFRHFYNLLASKNIREITKVWQDVKDYYLKFCEWYEDRELYHKIGFVIYANPKIDVKTLYDEARTRTKTDFGNYIDEKIRKSIIFKEKDNVLDIFEDLNYEQNPGEINTVLLLYNILTMIENGQKREDDGTVSIPDNSYFPFDSFKKTVWNIEHIASRHDKAPEGKYIQDWLNTVISYIKEDTDLKKELSEYKTKLEVEEADENEFRMLYEKTVDYFNDELGEEYKNKISNLALLDEKTNKGYGDGIFPKKRDFIINKDKYATFIPICTKKVFLKYLPSEYYPKDYVPKLSFWSKEDMEAYRADMENVLSKYISRDLKTGKGDE